MDATSMTSAASVTSLGFRTDLMLRELAGAVVVGHGSHLTVRTPANPGFWWGNFLLLAAPPGPGDAARWTAAFAGEFPEAAHLALGVDGTEGDTGDPAELARLGVTVDVSTVLTATRLPSPTRPAPAAEIRPLAGDDDWAQAAELRLSCEESELPPAELLFGERKLAENRRLCEAGHGAWFGAFVDGRLRSGAGIFGDGSGPARYQAVETSPGFRRRGLASSVVHEAGRWALRELGARNLVIVADPLYHAIRLYRSLGFTDAEHQVQLSRPPEESATP